MKRLISYLVTVAGCVSCLSTPAQATEYLLIPVGDGNDVENRTGHATGKPADGGSVNASSSCVGPNFPGASYLGTHINFLTQGEKPLQKVVLSTSEIAAGSQLTSIQKLDSDVFFPALCTAFGVDFEKHSAELVARGNAAAQFDNVAASAVPEPSTCLLAWFSLLSFIWRRRRRA